MDEDSSLKEFATENPEAEPDAESTGTKGSTTATEKSSEAGSKIEADAEETVAPTVSTYRYSPEKEACDACRTRAERRWRDSDGLVCGECKEW